MPKIKQKQKWINAEFSAIMVYWPSMPNYSQDSTKLAIAMNYDLAVHYHIFSDVDSLNLCLLAF